jgi:sporulation protein YlmC with PRC-barrel domain
MRFTLIATVSALALLAAPVLAQTNAPGSPGSSGSRSLGTGSTPSVTQHAPAPDPLKQEDVSQIKGASVYGSDSQKIGTVATVLMKPDSREIDRLVVAEGGVLGVGAHDVALPISQFRWDGDRDGFVIAKTADQLKSMPEWQRPENASSRGSSGAGSSVPPPARPTAGPSTTH